MKINTNELKAVQTLLASIGQDVKREGLIDTPKRYVKFLKEFCAPQKFKFTMFENEGSDRMIIVKDIPFFSLCEHHLAPFFGTAAIAYIPNDKIVGLSKLPRTLDLFARKPQNQERIGKEVADYLMNKLKPQGVAVMIQARHLCVEMRGVQKHSVQTITSEMRGVFLDDINCRQEFLSLIKNK